MKTTKILAFVLAVLMSLSCFCISAFAADNEATLDGTTTSKEIDQKYTLTTETGDYTDVTKVKVTWELTDISATVKVNKIWDPDTLTWIEDKNNASTATADDVTATFEFKNLSSVKIGASVAFAAESGITATATYKDNGEDGDGKIVLDSKAINTDATDDDLKGKVVVTVPADTKYFKAKAADETGTYGTYTVKIIKYIPVTGISFTNPTEQLQVGSEMALTATVSPLDATDKNITYSSSDTAVATVDKDGKVKGIAAGEAIITATGADGKSQTCTVTITVPKQVQEISAPTAESANIGTTTVTLTEIAAGQGTTLYGINTTDTAPEKWQTSAVFTELTKNTTYYFFAKYEGNDGYYEAVSAGTPIKTKNIYTITVSFKSNNYNPGANNATEVVEGDTVSLSYSPKDIDAGFYPSTSTINGTDFNHLGDNYDYKGNLVITITNAFENVVIYIHDDSM